MNRLDRRIAKKIPLINRKEFNEVHIAESAYMKDGDKFTIAGLRRMKDGSFITSCKPGKETIFVAKVNNV